jgi:hypothetical protein
MRLALALAGVAWPFVALMVAALWWGPRAPGRLPVLVVVLEVLAVAIPWLLSLRHEPLAGPSPRGFWVSLIVWPAVLMWPGTAWFAVLRPRVPSRFELASGLVLGAITGAILGFFVLALLG